MSELLDLIYRKQVFRNYKYLESIRNSPDFIILALYNYIRSFHTLMQKVIRQIF